MKFSHYYSNNLKFILKKQCAEAANDDSDAGIYINYYCIKLQLCTPQHFCHIIVFV